MRVVIAVSFLFLLLFLLNEVYGRDLGIYGDTHPISEIDIRVEISNKLEGYRDSGKLEEFNERYRDTVTKQIKQPSRVVGITDATKDRRRAFDPTVELEEDIMIPKGALNTNEYRAKLKGIKEENTEYEILYKAGTKINPLRYMVFNEPLIFVDGNNEEQMKFARDYQDSNPLSKIILIDGNAGFKEIEGKEYYYYFDQWGTYSGRFNIAFVPSVVYQKEGEEVLTIEEISLYQKKQALLKQLRGGQ